MLRDVGALPTVTLNARVCETYPEVVAACVEEGWELNAHSYDQVPMHKLEDQRGVIMRSMAIDEVAVQSNGCAARATNRVLIPRLLRTVPIENVRSVPGNDTLAAENLFEGAPDVIDAMGRSGEVGVAGDRHDLGPLLGFPIQALETSCPMHGAAAPS